MLPKLFAAVDLVEAGVIDQGFLDRVFKLSVTHSKDATLVGGTSTSLEDEGTLLKYRLLDGNDVSYYLPELAELYTTTLVQIASRLSGLTLRRSPDSVNGVNVNVLRAKGGRYEWHVDSNPVTGLLVLSHCDAAVGGRLLFERDAARQTAFCMRPGHFLVFDATKTPHAVEPVLGDAPRVTAPMNFFIEGEVVSRPVDLDATLYGK